MNRSCSPLVDVAIGDIALRGGVVGIANDVVVLLSTQFSVLPNTFVIVVDVGPLDVVVAVVVALIDAELGSVIVP